jgi:L-fucose mutarotase/ribose pyranase (RbsD/FucU family)
MSRNKSFWQNMKVSNPNLPERLGESWTDKEDGRVLELVQEEYSIQEIASELKRTDGSIKARLRHMAVDMYKNNLTIENITLLTSLSSDEITKSVRKDSEKEIEKKKKKEELAQVPVADIMEVKLVLYEMRDILRRIASKYSV